MINVDGILKNRYAIITGVSILIFIFGSPLALLPGSADVPLPVPVVSAIVNGNIISISWNSSPTDSVIGYDIYRSTQSEVLGEKLNKEHIKGLSYTETVLPNIYYYTIRAVADRSDDGNTKQLRIETGMAIPSELSVKINNNAKYTVSRDVQLALSAKNAKECRYKNDEDLDWGRWEQYTTKKSWTLSEGGDGTRAVFYQCMGSMESDFVIADITLDENAPIVKYMVNSVSDGVQIEIRVQDVVSPVINCTIKTTGWEKRFTILLSSGKGAQTQLMNVSSFILECKDEAGNINTQQVQTN